MPLFAFIGHDGHDGRLRRRRHRDAHLQQLEALSARGQLRFAGPLRDASGNPTGSIVIFEAADLDAARALAQTDPYVQHGVFERVEVFETTQVLPHP